MVSMVIVLFLVAVLVSLFLGRFAETLADRYRRRVEVRRPHRRLVQPVADMVKNEAV